MGQSKATAAKVKGKGRGYPRALSSNDPVILELWVRAGGRCEFHGCPDYLLQDKLTTNSAKLADIAHIVARSKKGPRGDDPLPLSARNEIDNLFLACTKHHRMIDNKKLVRKCPKSLLIEYKRSHEERIKYVTGLGDEHETVVVRLISKIRGRTVSISNEEIRKAVLTSAGRYPRYLGGEHHIEIDLTSLPETDQGFWEVGKARIKDIVNRRLVPAIENKEARHLSVFAFARIPFIAYLGRVIGDTIPVDVYQKQKAGDEGWAWLSSGEANKFRSLKEREGKNQSKVAIILSISGRIPIEQLAHDITDSFWIYSVMPDGIEPSRNVVRTKASFDEFKGTYERLLRKIEADHPQADLVHVFTAVPIPVALVIGRFVLPDVSPSLLVYDKGHQKFEPAITLEKISKA